MKTIERIAKNSVMILLARIFQMVTSFILMAIIARHLDPELFGDYAFIRNFVPIFLVVIYFGIQQIIVRQIARDKVNAGAYLGTAVLLRSAIAVVMVLIIVLVVKILRLSPRMASAIYIMIFAEILLAYAMLFISVFRAFEKMEYEMATTFISYTILLLLVLAVVYFNMGFFWLFVAIALANFVQLFLGFYLCYTKFVRPIFQIDFKLWKYLIKEAVFIGTSLCFISAAFRIDVLIIKALKGSTEVALFHAPHRLILNLMVFAFAFSSSLFPVFSRLAISTTHDKLRFVYEKVFKFYLVFTLPVSLLGAVFADKIILIIFGEKFLPAVISLQILIWATSFLFINNLTGILLTSLNKQKYNLISAFLCFCINLILGLMLVPGFGFVGASIATFISYFILCVTSFYFITRELGLISLNNLIKPLISSALMGIAIYVSKEMNLNIIAIVFIGTMMYGLTLFVVKTFSLEEIDMLKSLVMNTAKWG